MEENNKPPGVPSDARRLALTATLTATGLNPGALARSALSSIDFSVSAVAEAVIAADCEALELDDDTGGPMGGRLPSRAGRRRTSATSACPLPSTRRKVHGKR